MNIRYPIYEGVYRILTYEGHYQQLFYIIFSLFGMYVDVEVCTPKGRVDVVMHTTHTLSDWIIEG